jgi:serine/threonine protein kinase
MEMDNVQVASPELAHANLGEGPIPASTSMDMWGIGLVVYFLMSAKTFWHAQSAVKVFGALATASYTLDRDEIKHVNDYTRHILNQLLATNPSERMTLVEFEVVFTRHC